MRVLTALLLVVGIIIGGIGSALDQDSTSPFADPGLPEITIVGISGTGGNSRRSGARNHR